MHKSVNRYISELKLAKTPYLTTENQVLCGGAVLTVSPGLESDDIDSIRLDMPQQVQVNESAAWLLFFVAVIGAEKFCEIQPRIKAAMHGRGEFNETMVDGWNLRLYWEADHRVLLAEALYQP